MPISGAALLGAVERKLQEVDREGRTTPIGLLLFARAYAEAGVHLNQQEARLTEGHRGAPVQFLLMHSIELYLKSFLRLRGFTPKQLEKKLGHKFAKIAKEAEACGLVFNDEERYVIDAMEHTRAWTRSRYIETGFATSATPEALIRTCLSFDESVSAALKQEGHHVWPRKWPA